MCVDITSTNMHLSRCVGKLLDWFWEVKVMASIKVIVNWWVCAKGYILAHYCRLC